MEVKSILYLILSMVGTGFGDYYCKTNTTKAWLCYMCGSFMFIQLARCSGLIYSTAVWGILTAVIAVLIGYYKYNEALSTIQYIGCCGAFISIVLLQWR